MMDGLQILFSFVNSRNVLDGMSVLFFTHFDGGLYV